MKLVSFEECATTGFPLHFPFTIGKPLSAYRPLFERLEEDHRILPIHMRPLWPGTSTDYFRNWRLLPDILYRFRDDQKLHRLIYAGHSIYATKTLLQHDHFHTPGAHLPSHLPALNNPTVDSDLRPKSFLQSVPACARYLWRRDVFKHAVYLAFETLIEHK